MKVILTDLFMSRNEKANGDVINVIMSCTLAYGLCSYRKQIELITQRYRDEKVVSKEILNMKIFYKNNLDLYSLELQHPGFLLAEAQGIRVAETTNDFLVMTFLKELFSDEIDGFIAPSMFSPYHTNEYTSPEMIIFDPIKSGIIVVDDNVVPKKVEMLSLNDIVLSQFVKQPITYKNYLKITMRGGRPRSTSKNAKINSLNYDVYFNDPDNKEQLGKFKDVARHMRDEQGAFFPELPYPSHHVSPWCN